MKKPVLCKTCKHWMVTVVVGGKHPRTIDECYYPSNNCKAGHATKCEEYEMKESAK